MFLFFGGVGLFEFACVCFKWAVFYDVAVFLCCLCVCLPCCVYVMLLIDVFPKLLFCIVFVRKPWFCLLRCSCVVVVCMSYLGLLLLYVLLWLCFLLCMCRCVCVPALVCLLMYADLIICAVVVLFVVSFL